jgi:hypothetical protein
VNRAANGARAPTGPGQRLHHLRLSLEDLVAQVVADLLAREPDQAEAKEVVQVRGDPVDVAATGLRADHVEARGYQLSRDDADAERPAAAHVHRRVRAPLLQEPQYPRLVRRHHVEDPRVRGMAVLLEVDVRRAAQKLFAAPAQRGS